MTTEIQPFYAAGLFVSNKGNLLTVVHRKNAVYKLPGGTSEKQKGTPDAYNPRSKIQVKDKLFSTCLRVFGAEVMENQHQRQKIQSIICDITENFEDFHALQMVIEFIEEVGLIPRQFTFHQSQETGKNFFQYFYIIEEAYCYSKDRESFILITKDNLEENLPENGHDYHCVDTDIDRVEIIPLLEAAGKYNFARNHINPLNGYIISRSRG